MATEIPTTHSAYITTCAGWEDRLEAHPIWAFQHLYEIAFDFGDMKTSPEWTKWHTEDFTYTATTGVTTQGAAAWDAARAPYAPFTQHFHEPFFVVIFPTSSDGSTFELIGTAKLFANLPVPAGEGALKKKDLQGREWDVEAVGAFHFSYVKVGGEWKLSREKVFVDSTPAIGEMANRGMVNGDALVGMVKAAAAGAGAGGA